MGRGDAVEAALFNGPMDGVTSLPKSFVPCRVRLICRGKAEYDDKEPRNYPAERAIWTRPQGCNRPNHVIRPQESHAGISLLENPGASSGRLHALCAGACHPTLQNCIRRLKSDFCHFLSVAFVSNRVDP
eukprot:1356703-Rhodomonas_salina.2